MEAYMLTERDRARMMEALDALEAAIHEGDKFGALACLSVLRAVEIHSVDVTVTKRGE